MSRYSKDFSVTWSDIHRDAKELARRLAGIKWERIIAIARGGLIPAAIIARELEIRYVDTVCIATYDDRLQGEEVVLKDLQGDGEGWLVVDDLTDTGKTLHTVRRMLPNAHVATVYVKPEGRSLVDTFVTEVSQDTWILFPWDTDLVKTVPLARQAAALG